MSGKPVKSPEQLGRLLWEALRAEAPPGYRDCAIEVVRAKTGARDWGAKLLVRGAAADARLEQVFARAKAELQQRYGWTDD
jgi:hypothetical protein